ncbi:MAG: hypothetical protein ACI4UE_01895 [Candidatus Scatovivens sp.]
MEKVLNEKEIKDTKIRKEASQKAMKAMIGLTALLCLGVVCGVVVFSTLLNQL